MGESAPLSPTLRSSGLKLVIAEANRAFVADRLKIDPAIPIGVDDGTSVEISGIRFSGIASAHETVERDEHVRAKYLGYVLEFGGWTIYHNDDTVRYEGMAEKLRSFRTDVALPPINGRVPEKRVPGNLFGRAWAKDMDAKLVVRAISKCSNSIALRRSPRMPQAVSAFQGAALRRTTAQLVLRESLVFLLMRPAENLEDSSGPSHRCFTMPPGSSVGVPSLEPPCDLRRSASVSSRREFSCCPNSA